MADTLLREVEELVKRGMTAALRFDGAGIDQVTQEMESLPERLAGVDPDSLKKMSAAVSRYRDLCAFSGETLHAVLNDIVSSGDRGAKRYGGSGQLSQTPQTALVERYG